MHLIYHTPTIQNTILCPVVHTIHSVISCMIIVSITLLATERVHAFRLRKEKEGGMSKKATIVTLVTFWVVLIVVMIVLLIIHHLQGNNEYCLYDGIVKQFRINAILTPWAALTFVVAFTGIICMRRQEALSAEIKQAIIRPTLVFSCLGYVYVQVVAVLFCLFFFNKLLYCKLNTLLSLLARLFHVAFPVIWLVTWTRNGDISLPCIRMNRNRRPLPVNENDLANNGETDTFL